MNYTFHVPNAGHYINIFSCNHTDISADVCWDEVLTFSFPFPCVLKRHMYFGSHFSVVHQHGWTWFCRCSCFAWSCWSRFRTKSARLMFGTHFEHLINKQTTSYKHVCVSIDTEIVVYVCDYTYIMPTVFFTTKSARLIK